MVTLQTSIKMIDNLSRPVNNMVASMNKLIGRMENVKDVNIDAKEIQKAKMTIQDVEEQLKLAKTKLEENANAQNKWNDAMNRGGGAMGGILNRLKAVALAYGGIQGAKSLIGMSDKVMQIDARLNLITDNQNQKNSLKNYIYKLSQEARTPLNELTEKVAKVGLLAGDKFKGGNREIVDYVSTLSKAFKITGAGAQEASAAMYQLNQALVSGKLQGDEFRSVMENAPMLAQAIAKQMGVGMSELKKLGSEGKITSDVIRESVIGMTDDVNAKFNSLPMTWGDVWVKMKNFGIKSMEPILRKINEIANNPKIIQFGETLKDTFTSVLYIANKVFDFMATGIGFVYDMWDVLKYPIIGLTTALIAFNTVQAIANGLISFNATVEGIRAAALMISEGATFAATVSQWGLNTALYAFPATWIVLAIASVIAIIVTFIRHITGATTIAGFFAGAWEMAKATIYNIWAGIVNVFYITKELLINNLNALIRGTSQGVSMFANLFVDAFNYIMKKGTSFMNGLLSVLSKANPLLNKIGINIPEKAGQAFQLDRVDIQAKEIGNKTQGKRLTYKDVVAEGKYAAYVADMKQKEKKDSLFNFGGLSKDFGMGGKEFDADNAKNIGDTAKNTKKMSDNLEDSQEEMKYLRELAEQEHINQFTTAEIKVDMQNNNQITQASDFDDLLRKLSEKLEETLKTTANGVYY